MTDVTILTATTGRQSLFKCMESVGNQTCSEKIQHLIMIDGPENATEAYSHIHDIVDSKVNTESNHEIDIIDIPYSVGRDRYNGHLMYAAGTFLARGQYIMYLDDDNTIAPTHIQDCITDIKSGDYGWAYTLRNIVDQRGNFICKDDCESIGPDYPTILDEKDRLVDVGCYFIHHKLAAFVSPIWHRKAREPGVMEVDRALVQVLAGTAKGIGTGRYTLNYAVGSTDISVAANFFLKGNEEMAKRYPNGFPWRR